MFNTFISALQGPAEEAVDDSATVLVPAQPNAEPPSVSEAPGPDPTSAAKPAAPGPSDGEAAPAQAEAGAGAGAARAAAGSSTGEQAPVAESAPGPAGQAGAGTAFSFWGMASGLVDTVRKGTNELASRCEPASSAAGETCWRWIMVL